MHKRHSPGQWWNSGGHISCTVVQLWEKSQSFITSGMSLNPSRPEMSVVLLAAFVKHVPSLQFHTLCTVKTPCVFAAGIFKINAWMCLGWLSGFSVSWSNETELWEAQMFGSRRAPVNSLQRNAWLAPGSGRLFSHKIQSSHIIRFGHRFISTVNTDIPFRKSRVKMSALPVAWAGREQWMYHRQTLHWWKIWHVAEWNKFGSRALKLREDSCLKTYLKCYMLKTQSGMY